MIRIDAIWLAIEPMDMHAGWRESLQRGVPAQPHCAYLSAALDLPYALEDMADRHRDEGQSKSAP